MSTRTRAKPQERSEGFPSVPAGKTVTVVLTGFSHHWEDVGEGKKEDTGRIRIMANTHDYDGQMYDPVDPGRFVAFPIFIVGLGEYAGARVSMATNLKKLEVDTLGQTWLYRFQDDATWKNKFTRVLEAAGFAFVDGETTAWMQAVDAFLETVEDKPYLWLPVPSKAVMAEKGLDEMEPLPGVTRELILMGIESILADRLPIMMLTTRKAARKDGSAAVRVQHDSVSRLPFELEANTRAGIYQNEAAMESINRAIAARRGGLALPLSAATLGMPGFETVDDHAGAQIPFTPGDTESPAARAGKIVLRDHINRVAVALGDPFRNQAWDVISDFLRPYGMANQKGTGFIDIPFGQITVAFLAVMEKAGVLDKGLCLSMDEVTLLRDAGLDTSFFARYIHPDAAPAATEPEWAGMPDTFEMAGMPDTF